MPHLVLHRRLPPGQRAGIKQAAQAVGAESAQCDAECGEQGAGKQGKTLNVVHVRVDFFLMGWGEARSMEAVAVCGCDGLPYAWVCGEIVAGVATAGSIGARPE